MNDKHPMRNKIEKIGAGSAQTAQAPCSIAFRSVAITDHRPSTAETGESSEIANRTVVLAFSIR